MLPDSHDTPSSRTQCPVHASISCLVGRQLPSPKGFVTDRFVGVPGAVVPETAIHKYGYLEACENKVRPAQNWVMPAPTGDALTAKNVAEREFRVLVSLRLDLRHHFGALLSREHVRAFARTPPSPIPLRGYRHVPVDSPRKDGRSHQG
jgi:hypothetical protein